MNWQIILSTIKESALGNFRRAGDQRGDFNSAEFHKKLA